MPVKHAFTSAKADDSDSTLIRPSNWNADHTIEANTVGDAEISAHTTTKITVPWSSLTFAGSTLLDLVTRNHQDLLNIGVDNHHAQLHQVAHNLGGGDALKLDDLATPDDNLDLNASTVRHGLLLKLLGGTTNFLREDGTWALPSGGGNATVMHMVACAALSKTMTNIGTAYKDIYVSLTDLGNDKHVIDFEGATSVRIIFFWDYVGVGTQQVRWVNQADNANVLFESATFTADQDPGDSGWVALPAWATGVKTIEWQGKSTTAADDPVAKGFRIFLK